MHIIPVIDVRHGIAVKAVAGDRANYRPLVSPLVSSHWVPWGQTHGPAPNAPSAEAVAFAFSRLYSFDTIYVADLDGIEGRDRNENLSRSLSRTLPDVAFWIDAGLREPPPDDAATAVIGSETLTGHELRPIAPQSVLSLDFRGDTFLGPRALLQRPELWPQRIIVMTLARVGADRGPDLERIAEIAALAPQSRVYAAGGIRDAADLRAAHGAGACGALIATALHAQKIKADDLDEIIGL